MEVNSVCRNVHHTFLPYEYLLPLLLSRDTPTEISLLDTAVYNSIPPCLSVCNNPTCVQFYTISTVSFRYAETSQATKQNYPIPASYPYVCLFFVYSLTQPVHSIPGAVLNKAFENMFFDTDRRLRSLITFVWLPSRGVCLRLHISA